MKPAEEKQAARERVWAALDDAGVARFPRPIWGRIPNFTGAEAAARALIARPEFQRARVVKVNPDAPQRYLRAEVLRHGKILLAPTPRLREGFLVLDPAEIPPGAYGKAAAIGGLFTYGVPTPLADAPSPALLVVGSVAVSPAGARAGKGEGCPLPSAARSGYTYRVRTSPTRLPSAGTGRGVRSRSTEPERRSP